MFDSVWVGDSGRQLAGKYRSFSGVTIKPRPVQQPCTRLGRGESRARDGARAIALRITSWDQRGQFNRLVNEVVPRVNV